MTNNELYTVALISLILNIVALFCLFSPNICYLLHKKFFKWRDNYDKTVSNNKD